MLDMREQTVASVRKALADKFACAGIDSPDADARLLIADALDLDRAGLAGCPARTLTPDECSAIDALAARRLKREPVARILGEKEFWSLPLKIDGAVLVPRPETETVVEAALEAVKKMKSESLRVLDIGTGSGALLLALLSELPGARGTGTDISAEALAVARGNAERLQLAGRCTFLEGNGAGDARGPFDLILSNPPYIASGDIAALAPEVRDYDPMLALDGGTDGLDGYRMVVREACRLLAPGGRLIVELGVGQEEAVRALFTQAELSAVAARKDLSDITRALTATA